MSMSSRDFRMDIGENKFDENKSFIGIVVGSIVEFRVHGPAACCVRG